MAVSTNAAARESYFSRAAVEYYSSSRSWRARLREVMASSSFECGVAALILANSVVIGVEVEYMARHGTSSAPTPFVLINAGFTVLYLFELLLRLFVQRCHFFRSSDWKWGVLDVAIVLLSMVEMGANIIVLLQASGEVSAGMGGSGRAMRVLRLARLLRALRIPRLIRFVYALRTLVYSIFATLRSLVWAMTLLLLEMYIFAIIFTQSTIYYINDEQDFNPLLKTFWGTLPETMFTLFKAITGGVSWHDIVVPLADVSMFLVSIFTVFIFFTSFAVLNVITGIFCNSAIEAAERDPDLAVQSLVANKRVYAEKIRKLFTHMDSDESGLITLQELESIMTDDNLKGYFNALQIDTTDAWTLFKLIDADKTGAIDIDEFVWGVMRLKGAAKATDLATLTHDVRWIMKQLSKFIRYTETQFAQLDRASLGMRLPAAHAADVNDRQPPSM